MRDGGSEEGRVCGDGVREGSLRKAEIRSVGLKCMTLQLYLQANPKSLRAYTLWDVLLEKMR